MELCRYLCRNESSRAVAESMIKGKIPDNCYQKIEEPGFTAMVELTDFKERVIKKKILNC